MKLLDSFVSTNLKKKTLDCGTEATVLRQVSKHACGPGTIDAIGLLITASAQSLVLFEPFFLFLFCFVFYK